MRTPTPHQKGEGRADREAIDTCTCRVRRGIRCRVIQTAAKLVLEPIFEADFEDSAYGYRPRRSAVDAVKETHRLIRRGYTDVVDADLSKYLDTVSYCPLVHEP